MPAVILSRELARQFTDGETKVDVDGENLTVREPYSQARFASPRDRARASHGYGDCYRRSDLPRLHAGRMFPAHARFVFAGHRRWLNTGAMRSLCTCPQLVISNTI